MILPAQTIRALRLVRPCAERTVFEGVTYGLGPAGYDLRIATAVDLAPGCSALVDAIEEFDMPDDVLGFLLTKSTWARLHVECANTIIEPGWRGQLRLELNKHGGYGVTHIPAGVGVGHVVFARLEDPTEQPYNGKYQDQKANTNAIFEA